MGSHLFTKQSEDYARFRPEYPAGLFDFVASAAPSRQLALDIATGTGQAARGLARFFDRVIATDGSAEQVAHASGPANVDFRHAEAEAEVAAPGTAQLVVVAQALHWFCHEKFYSTVKRALAPSGVFAAWAYGFPQAEADLDPLIDELGSKRLDPFWSEGNRLIMRGYHTLPFPFAELLAPTFHLEADWHLEQLLGHFRSWSGFQKAVDAGRESELSPLLSQICEAWGSPENVRRIRWPLQLRIGKRD